jgi:hypothetical protein
MVIEACALNGRKNAGRRKASICRVGWALQQSTLGHAFRVGGAVQQSNILRGKLPYIELLFGLTFL